MPTGVQQRPGDTEAPVPVTDLVTFHAQNLAVPARRGADKPEVPSGKKVFYEPGCISCHTPKFVTRRDAPNKAHSFQLIWPYSDFLLHVVFDTQSGRVVAAADLTEVCGIAPDRAGFMATSGAGAISRPDAETVSAPDHVWDNHPLGIGKPV